MVRRNSRRTVSLGWLAFSAFMGAMASPAWAQRDVFSQPVLGFIPKPGWPPSGPPPRLTDGQPDLSGPWAPNALRFNVDTSSQVKDIPLQPWAAEVLKQRRAANGKDDPVGFCLPPGVPQINVMPYPFRVLQTPGLIVIIYEGGDHAWRQIFMDGRPHPSDPNPTWMGHSIGRWDGDTLVVDTVGFNGRFWIDGAGLPTTEALHVIERFRRVNKGYLEIEQTIDDPRAYTRPWTFTIRPMLYDGELMEYICQENNLDIPHLVGK
jgi:hypothetical protein